MNAICSRVEAAIMNAIATHIIHSAKLLNPNVFFMVWVLELSINIARCKPGSHCLPCSKESVFEYSNNSD